MKLFAFLCCICFLFIKCNIHTPEGDYDYNLIIENKTQKKVELNTYKSIELINSITIDPNSNYSESFILKGRDYGTKSDDRLLFDISSIVIIYEKEKIAFFNCGLNVDSCSERNNPLRYKYEVNTVKYTITEEDYQNAEDCDGRCE